MKTTNNPRRPSPQSDQPSLSGKILRARVDKTFRDHCEIDLLDPEDDRIIARGRLYQSESTAWKDPKLLADISRYQSGESLEAVFVKHHRHEQDQELWYVHERWGLNNPWKNLALADGDIVTGVITRPITSVSSNELAGYFIQLDVGAAFQGNSARNDISSERLQPDIEVFLPSDELPWADGSLGFSPSSAETGRLSLEIGDAIQAILLEIHVPPKVPVVSLTRLINNRDASAQRDFNHSDAMGRWRFRRLLGNTQEVSHEDVTSLAFSQEEKPYAGRHLLLVDDDGEAMASQAELLALMGATVERILVKPNGFAQAIGEVVAALRKFQFDLALIDNNLPGRDLGQTLIERVRVRLGTDHPIRLVLLTANAIKTATTDTLATLRVKGASSMVHRPISHAVLQKLLAGEEVWEMAVSDGDGKAGQRLPISLGSSTIQGMLDIIAQQTGVSFAVLVRAHRHIEAQDLISSGSVPFRREDYPNALIKTDLRLLVDDRIAQLIITAKESGNEYLRVGGTGPAYWQIIETAGERWIFGLGHVPGRDIRNQLPLWCSALVAMLEAQAWRDWAQHVSSFVQLGLAHQGLSHEVINLEDEITSLLDSLRRWLAKQMPGVALEGKVRNYIDDKIAALTKSSSDLLDFSKRQLRGHALRHQKVFLPDAVAAIKRIVITECRESEVALHVADPPPLALPLPNAALVLPTVNLLVNAAKHHYRSENRRVELLFDLEQDGVQQFLLMDVRDNGPGLEQSTLKRLWQPGFSSAAEIDKRHGIGLWLARQMVKEAGGRLDLHENWRGLGACFRLRFPIHLG